MVGGVLAVAAVGFTLPVADGAGSPEVEVAEASIEGVAEAAAAALRTGARAGSEAVALEPVEAPRALAVITGSASYYADKFEGRTTASGVPFRQAEMWAAHRTLPFGTVLRVTNEANGKEVEVEVVDRGPYAHGRVLDLSRRAARELDFIRSGHTRVKIEVLSRP